MWQMCGCATVLTVHQRKVISVTESASISDKLLNKPGLAVFDDQFDSLFRETRNKLGRVRIVVNIHYERTELAMCPCWCIVPAVSL